MTPNLTPDSLEEFANMLREGEPTPLGIDLLLSCAALWRADRRRLEAYRLALMQIRDGSQGNAGRCMDCDSVARVANAALAAGEEKDHSPKEANQ